MTKVKFYLDKPANSFKTVLAYFPEMPYNDKFMTCYEHIGQHSGCSLQYVKGKKLAKYNEYFDLLRELIGQGYKDLQVVNLDHQTTEYHRPPTDYELKFGEGATHYREFKLSEIGINKKGNLKQWFIANDGLRYNSF